MALSDLPHPGLGNSGGRGSCLPYEVGGKEGCQLTQAFEQEQTSCPQMKKWERSGQTPVSLNSLSELRLLSWNQ